MKRNTTPALPIKIHMPFGEVKRLEFIFKAGIGDYYPALVHKTFESQEKIPIEGEEVDANESFVVKLKLDAKDTMSLPAGEVYMDTLIVLNDGFIPETKIVTINVEETLFSEVYSGG